MERKLRTALVVLALFCSALPAWGAEKTVTDDKNKDGKPDVFVTWDNGKRVRGEADRDFDGKIDTWYLYDAAGKSTRTARDSNGDGKPDEFKDMLKGRVLVLKSNDRNFDGRIDRRRLEEWDANKGITTFVNGRSQKIPNPGYTAIWTEEDNDYDGKVDVYKERGNKNPPRDKIGQPIDTEVNV